MKLKWSLTREYFGICDFPKNNQKSNTSLTSHQAHQSKSKSKSKSIPPPKVIQSPFSHKFPIPCKPTLPTQPLKTAVYPTLLSFSHPTFLFPAPRTHTHHPLSGAFWRGFVPSLLPWFGISNPSPTRTPASPGTPRAGKKKTGSGIREG